MKGTWQSIKNLENATQKPVRTFVRTGICHAVYNTFPKKAFVLSSCGVSNNAIGLFSSTI